MSSGSPDLDDSTMNASEKLAYVMEVRDIFGDDAAETLADQLGIFLPGLRDDNAREGERGLATHPS